jgi:uncharacterized protein YdeI (YjbR/CyaY-like superfamily)
VSEPVYFATPAALARWFKKNGANTTELIVGFMKVDTGVPSVTWPQAVDEALCVGWIDGVRHRIDDERYKIRFTPRKASSHWSAVNIKRIAVLLEEGRMQPSGMAAFERRTEAKSQRAAYEQPTMPELNDAEIAVFKKNAKGWAYFETVPPGYRKRMVWWVVSAKQLVTRDKRLGLLIQACADGVRL